MAEANLEGVKPAPVIEVPGHSLIVLIGPAGSGKSTFAQRHFLRTQIVSSDECRAMLSDDPANQRVTGYAFELMHFIIERRLRLGRLTVADATSLKRDDREAIRRLAEAREVPTIAIVFNLPLEVCLRRNAGRERVVPEEALRNQYALLEETLRTIGNEGFAAVYVLDEAGQIVAVSFINPSPASPPSTF